MKKLILTFATTLLAIACAANTESFTNSTPAQRDAAEAVRMAEKPQAPAERLTYADFRMIKRQIDFNFQRLKSVSLAAMQCHMSVEHVNHLFKRYAHEDAEKYLENLKRNFRTATLLKNAESAAHPETTSWLARYLNGR